MQEPDVVVVANVDDGLDGIPVQRAARICCTSDRGGIGGGQRADERDGSGGEKQPVGTTTNGLEATIGVTIGGGVPVPGRRDRDA
jgi:hypothetical protein